MSNPKRIHIVLFGIGNVGSTLISQLLAAANQLETNQNIQLKIPILANSKKAFFGNVVEGNNWEENFNTHAVPYSLQDILNHVQENNYENLIAIDATSSNSLSEQYINLVEHGFHIVSANKVANTLSIEFYEQLRHTLKKKNRTFLYETNVGAGLPVIETIKNLYECGERIEKIRGVFSGSLSYIFNTFSSQEVAFSNILQEATTLGLTEPDAREDLSGNDVARKLLILARELSLRKELKDVLVESLVPKKLNGKTTLTEFRARSKELDVPFQNLKNRSQKDTVLRYVGELDVATEKLQVRLVEEAKSSAIGQLQGADAVFEIYTQSYGDLPIVIRGAGAGKEVTARGVLSDIIKISANLN